MGVLLGAELLPSLSGRVWECAGIGLLRTQARVSLASFLLLLLVRCRARVLRAGLDGAALNAGRAWILGGGVFDGFGQSLFFLFLDFVLRRAFLPQLLSQTDEIGRGVVTDTATGSARILGCNRAKTILSAIHTERQPGTANHRARNKLKDVTPV